MTAKAKYYTGGILGYARATVTVSGSASSGTLTTDADKYCGGLVGYYRNETTGSYSTCRSTSAQAGGLFGYYMGAAYHHVTACFTDNTQIDAINGFSDNTLTAEEANATMRVDNIADKKDEMNGAIAAAGLAVRGERRHDHGRQRDLRPGSDRLPAQTRKDELTTPADIPHHRHFQGVPPTEGRPFSVPGRHNYFLVLRYSVGDSPVCFLKKRPR